MVDRQEPTIQSWNIESPSPTPRETKHRGSLRKRNRPQLWLMVLFWFVGLLLGLVWWASQHFEPRGTAWEMHIPALIPLAVAMLAGGVLVLLRGWAGGIAGIVTAALLVGYLLLTISTVTGGLLFALFILGCALVNATYFRRAAP